MNIVIVGLGLIGGSLAKSIKKYTNYKIIGIDSNYELCKTALEQGCIDQIGNELLLGEADIIYLCIYPQDSINFIVGNLKRIPNECIVTDTAGIKSGICLELYKLAKDNNFIFIGGHPMAGKEKSGFLASDPELFKNASYLFTPNGPPNKHVKTLEDIAYKIGFSHVCITTPEHHDEMIAFTSQLPHVLACSYIINNKTIGHKGFSAGSFKDVSRVANINETLWAELFIGNKDNLINEIELLRSNLELFSNALKDNNLSELYNLMIKAKKLVRI